jgi:hypothetical protein
MYSLWPTFHLWQEYFSSYKFQDAKYVYKRELHLTDTINK